MRAVGDVGVTARPTGGAAIRRGEGAGLMAVSLSWDAEMAENGRRAVGRINRPTGAVCSERIGWKKCEEAFSRDCVVTYLVPQSL